MGKNKNIARLSFSTKTTDYLSSGKCIFVIGLDDIASIEYLTTENAAICATSKNEIKEKLQQIVENNEIINRYAEKAFQCGLKNHSTENIKNIMMNKFCNL